MNGMYNRHRGILLEMQNAEYRMQNDKNNIQYSAFNILHSFFLSGTSWMAVTARRGARIMPPMPQSLKPT